MNKCNYYFFTLIFITTNVNYSMEISPKLKSKKSPKIEKKAPKKSSSEPSNILRLVSNKIKFQRVEEDIVTLLEKSKFRQPKEKVKTLLEENKNGEKLIGAYLDHAKALLDYKEKNNKAQYQRLLSANYAIKSVTVIRKEYCDDQFISEEIAVKENKIRSNLSHQFELLVMAYLNRSNNLLDDVKRAARRYSELMDLHMHNRDDLNHFQQKKLDMKIKTKTEERINKIMVVHCQEIIISKMVINHLDKNSTKKNEIDDQLFSIRNLLAKNFEYFAKLTETPDSERALYIKLSIQNYGAIQSTLLDAAEKNKKDAEKMLNELLNKDHLIDLTFDEIRYSNRDELVNAITMAMFYDKTKAHITNEKIDNFINNLSSINDNTKENLKTLANQYKQYMHERNEYLRQILPIETKFFKLLGQLYTLSPNSKKDYNNCKETYTQLNSRFRNLYPECWSDHFERVITQ